MLIFWLKEKHIINKKLGGRSTLFSSWLTPWKINQEKTFPIQRVHWAFTFKKSSNKSLLPFSWDSCFPLSTSSSDNQCSYSGNTCDPSLQRSVYFSYSLCCITASSESLEGDSSWYRMHKGRETVGHFRTECWKGSRNSPSCRKTVKTESNSWKEVEQIPEIDQIL